MSVTDPILSVVIPTHNRAEFVGRAVESVLSQTNCPSIEVVVVDDASRDHTPDVLAGFRGRIEVIRLEEPIERSRSRNSGAEHARGNILAFLDSDDEWLPDKAAAQAGIAAERACVTGIEIIDASGRPRNVHIPPALARERIAFENLYLATPSTLMLPRSLFFSIGGFPADPEVQGSEDWVLLARLVARGHEPEVIPQPLVRYRVHDQNSTGNPAAVARSMWAALDLMETEGLVTGDAVPKARAHVAGVIGRQFASRRRWAEAATWGRTALTAQPWPVGLKSCSLIAASALRGSLARRSSA